MIYQTDRELLFYYYTYSMKELLEEYKSTVKYLDKHCSNEPSVKRKYKHEHDVWVSLSHHWLDTIQAIRNAILFKKILKWEDTMFIDEDLSHVVVLASPPLNGYTPDNIRELLEADPRDACIASVTAAVNNQVGWLGHQCDDPENDEQTNKRFSSEFDAWNALYKELVDRIIHRLMEQNKNEGTNYPVTGEGMHYIIEPFMKQNGYRDGAGWWVKNKD